MCKASWTVSTTNEFQLTPSNLRYYIQKTHTIHPKFVNNKTTRADLSLELAIVV